MDEQLRNYESTIKTKSVFGFTPKYKETIATSLGKEFFIPVVLKTFEKLGWEIAYYDDTVAEAKYKLKKWGGSEYSDYITVTYSVGASEVESKSLGNEMWDAGRSSKRVKLFIYAFEQTLKGMDPESLKALQQERKSLENWDDYVVPDSLPQPAGVKKPNLAILITGAVLITVIAGAIIGYLTAKGFYYIFLVEMAAAFLIGYVMSLLVKLSGFTDFNRLQYVVYAIVLGVFCTNLYFQYLFIVQPGYADMSFTSFLKLRFEAGIRLKKLNPGTIGLIITWLVQLLVLGWFLYARVFTLLTGYLISRIPTEVIDFAWYHFAKNKTEDEVRKELAQKGWTEVEQQDQVFEALGNIQVARNLSREN